MSVYYNYMTGEEYTGPFPDPVEGFERKEQDGVVVYIPKSTSKEDPDYEDELERHLFVHEGVRKYDSKPDWAVS